MSRKYALRVIIRLSLNKIRVVSIKKKKKMKCKKRKSEIFLNFCNKIFFPLKLNHNQFFLNSFPEEIDWAEQITQ